MRAGDLRHRIVADNPVATQGPSGEEIITWSDENTGSLTLWAKVEPLKGRELANANQLLAILDSRITIRWSPNANQITEKWRIRFAGVTYDIKNIAHVKFEQRMIQLDCKSGANNG